MKKFNLELAKAGHPVCTRAGRNVRIICYDCKELICDKSHPIVALVELPNGLEYLREYTIDGCLIANRGEYDDDLMMIDSDLQADMEFAENCIRQAAPRREADTSKYDITLEDFTDVQIIAELRGRGYSGMLSKRVEV